MIFVVIVVLYTMISFSPLSMYYLKIQRKIVSGHGSGQETRGSYG